MGLVALIRDADSDCLYQQRIIFRGLKIGRPSALVTPDANHQTKNSGAAGTADEHLASTHHI